MPLPVCRIVACWVLGAALSAIMPSAKAILAVPTAKHKEKPNKEKEKIFERQTGA